MSFARIISWSSGLPLAVGGYALFYCIEKARLAAGSTTSVGDEVIVLAYVATLTTTLVSCVAAFIVRREAVLFRALPAAALLSCGLALGFWAWLHLSGVVVAYSSLMQP